MFYFHPYLGKIPILTNIFHRQLDNFHFSPQKKIGILAPGILELGFHLLNDIGAMKFSDTVNFATKIHM